MSYALFEESGDLKAGTVLSDAGTSLQVELTTGRRAKVKSTLVLLRFDGAEPGALLRDARAQADAIDVDFLWECAPQDEFDFRDLAADYFGHAPQPVEATALLMCLQAAPVYFQRKGRGRFRPAPPETLKAALAALERRRRQEALIDEYAAAMLAGELPGEIARLAPELILRPDKQSVAWRALERAVAGGRRSAPRLLLELGAFGGAGEMHRCLFEAEHFPAGIGFAPAAASVPPHWRERIDALPEAEVAAFSIDDSSTTEIDDALSVARLPDGTIRVGVHIAAPAVGVDPGDPLDRVARDRLSTVYMPGDKITMFPAALIESFSLDAGRRTPALSLYVDLDADGTRIVGRHSRVERVLVADNLRHDRLDEVVTEAALADPQAPMPHGDALRVLWRLAGSLSAERERVRGKPEQRFRTDFSFHVDGDSVRIVQRRRDAPLDRIVAEMMILANAEWGRVLAEARVPGLYRGQQAGRVRMSTQPLPHEGIGVPQYVWATSPLRRYVDLVNQRQVIALLAGARVPYPPNDAELFSIVSAFDNRHAAYGEFQQRMERYWCLRWLEQRGTSRMAAVTVRDELVRLVEAPLYFRLADVPTLPPGRRIAVDLIGWDFVDLSVQARFVEVVNASAAAAAQPDEALEEALADAASSAFVDGPTEAPAPGANADEAAAAAAGAAPQISGAG